MNKLAGKHFLVFDTPSPKTERLRASLIREGATVHVAGSITAASKHLSRRPVDTAFVAYRADPVTREFCRTLDHLRIPKIFTGAYPEPTSATLADADVVCA